jgi:asparagine synthase (glutamine-hydrolysing)
MCGIAGIVAYRETAPRVDRAELLAVRESMAVRGPDGSGLWTSPDERTGLAHRRLAIIDPTEAASQPMASADGRLHITFNGEIYNYRELRGELADRGRAFRTTSDTEVLLALYAERGAAMVEVLRGMYAFAIWDEGRKTLFLARDPFGIKPLYYADDGSTLRFASQVKALVAGGGVGREPDAAGHVGFFVLGSVPEPFTMYRDVQALPAGSTLTLRRGGAPAVARFFDVAAETLRANESFRGIRQSERGDYLLGTLRDSVKSHMVADVPVGVFLSSGLDSSMVAALARQVSGAPLHSVTLGFEEYRGTPNDEVPLAARTAERLGTTHRTRWVHRAAFEEAFERLLESMDQPSIDGVNTYFVSMAAAEAGMKVALSGLGGDELFGGYPSFRDVPRIERIIRGLRASPGVGTWIRRMAAPWVSAVASPKYASLVEYGGTYPGAYLLRRALYMPWEVSRLMDDAFFAQGWERLQLLPGLERSIQGIANGHQRVAALELSWYMRNQLLRDADWAGMAHSLEIRVPLVDPQVFRAVTPMMLDPDPPTKQAVAQMLAAELPREILQRRKTGFSIPVHDWAKRAGPAFGSQRHLRNWARIVSRPYKRLRFLVLATDAYGGNGGIAKFNRDLLGALCAMPECDRVVALPRLVPNSPGPLPGKLDYVLAASGGKARFVLESLRIAAGRRFDVIVAGHVNLLSIASLIGKAQRAPVALVIHGIDAWTPRASPVTNFFARHVGAVIAVSRLTLERFVEWSRCRGERHVLPNCVDLAAFGPGPRSADLARSLGIDGDAPAIMTLGRMSELERYKGFDEVIDLLPRLVRQFPRLRYLACGEGPDRARLEARVDELGLREHVVFAGFVPESRKADFYRLADAYVMPSRGEGFGIVFLEAAACGVPLVGSKADGGREALLEGRLGRLVDPDDQDEIEAAVVEALASPKRVLEELRHFSSENFERRAAAIARDIAHAPYGLRMLARAHASRAKGAATLAPAPIADRTHVR